MTTARCESDVAVLGSDFSDRARNGPVDGVVSMRGTGFIHLRGRRVARGRRRSGPFAVAAVLVAGSVVVAGFVGAPGQAAAVARPSVTKLSVHAGSTGGGTRVRITGRNLSHVRWVEFGSTRARIVSTPGATAVVVVSPGHSAGVVAVRVRTAGGLSATVASDRYTYRRPPAQVSVGTDFGLSFACARSATWARCWGAEVDGELGNGTTSSIELPPVNVTGLGAGVRDISAGAQDACAVTATHAAKCWGSEDSGRLGNGVDDLNGVVSTPVPVDGLGSGVRSIFADGSDTCAVTTAGVVKCWGFGGQLMLGPNGPTPGLVSAVPVTIAGLPSVRSVAVESDNAICALTTTGGVKCWGGNTSGQLGAGLGTGFEAFTPVQVKGLSAGVRSLAAAGSTACAVTAGGAVKCWGWNGDGVLGNGKEYSFQHFSSVPVQVKGLRSGEASVTLGPDDTACALSTTGRARCWGYEGNNGLLGDANVDGNPSDVPVQVVGMTRGVKDLSIGTDTACALTRTGQVKCWGVVPLAGGRTESPVPLTLPWYR
jgi:alpha-tubulin suppressor-like RCC1 family protein